MTDADIVTRLREAFEPDQLLMDAAADEIERLRADARRYQQLKARSYKEGQDGGWLGSFKFYPVPAWDDTPYSAARKEGFHYTSLEEALDAAHKA